MLARGVRLLLALALLWPAVVRAKEGPAWDPKQTRAFLASVVTWKDPDLAPFTRPRLDHDLVATLVTAGVPRENIVFLTDDEATLARVRAGLSQVAASATAGSTLVFYFQGHGLRARGRTTFAVHDIDTDRAEATGLTADEVADVLARRWRGERLMLFGDACHSGALTEVARAVEAARPAAKVAAITSATMSNRSTGFWTYTESLIAAFAGEPVLDRDGSGGITFREVERFVHDEMKFAERQLVGSLRGGAFESDFVLRSVPRVPPGAESGPSSGSAPGSSGPSSGSAPGSSGPSSGYAPGSSGPSSGYAPGSSGPSSGYAPGSSGAGGGPWLVGDYVEARDREGTWYGARVVEARGGRWKVHFPGWDAKWDDWVDAQGIRPIARGKLEVGRRVEVERTAGEWREATVMHVLEDYFWYVHYAGEAGDEDEWITADRARPLSGPRDGGPPLVALRPRPVSVGQVVAARWRDRWFLATVVRRTPEGLWRVRYADDTDGTLIDEELIGLADPVARGDRVLACWQGRPEMYEGTVEAVDQSAARIRWDDGSPSSRVALGQVAVVKAGR
jgi:hypothetical protein